MSSGPAIIPPIADDDRLPHDRAVWRQPPGPRNCADFIQITVEYAGGFMEQTTVGKVSWRNVARWRFGWPPKGGSHDQ